MHEWPCHVILMLKQIIAAMALCAAALPVMAQDAEPGHLTPAEQEFATLVTWEGRWTVAETEALEIVFELTARGTVLIERWETARGLHSMTVYHLDGESVLATHYCPQGNQPRLETGPGSLGPLHFTFRDASDLDPDESHAHELWFEVQDDGTIRRSEIYQSDDGPGEPTHYTLKRKS